MADWLNFLTLLGAIQGLFFAAVLLGLPAGKRIANRFLALFLMAFSLSMLGITGYFSRWVLEFPHFGLVHSPLGAILGAPFLLYLLALSSKKFVIRLRHWMLFLPGLIVLVWLIPFYTLPAEEKRRLLEASYTDFPANWRYIFIFSNLVNFGYLAASYVTVLRHERVIRQVYSSSRNKTLSWTRSFLYGGLLIFISCTVLSAWSINWADAWSNLGFSVLIYIFGYRALRQPEIFSDIGPDAMPEEGDLPLVHPAGKYEKSGLPDLQATALVEKLKNLMAREQIYLDPELKLSQLSDRLNITPHQTSQLLNRFVGENFSDFVNRYRVEHFIKAAQNPANRHLSLLAIAFDSGFNSKAAFNAVFKKITGQTPSQMMNASDRASRSTLK